MKHPSIAINRQGGNALISVMIAIMILTLLSALGAGRVMQEVNDSAAESTGSYLLTIRGAVLNALSQYNHAFTLIDTTGAPAGTYPVAPAWAGFSGPSKTISVTDLKTSGLLRNDFPDTPPFGRSAHIVFLRSGTCPGQDCTVDAYVYTCWPISTARPSGAVSVTTCSAPPAGIQFDSALVANTIMATDGYGGSNAINPARMTGALFNMPTSTLGLSTSSPGQIAVIASLNSTMFTQFVRQGDTRHIYLNDDLTVQGQIETDTGILVSTSVIKGSACTAEGMYATTNLQSMAMCKGGRWFELSGYTIIGSSYVANGGTAPSPACPGSHLTPFYMASLGNVDSLMSGTSNIAVNGSFSGPASVTGRTDASGNVTGTGSVSGTFTSNNTSSIRVTQTVSVSATGLVTISNAQASARALVITGCRSI